LITGGVAFYNINGKPKFLLASQVEDPILFAGTDNFCDQGNYAGGSYVDCRDRSQPGFKPIAKQINPLPNQPAPNREETTYYLAHDDNSAYTPTGDVRFDPTKPRTSPRARSFLPGGKP
jgi:hypothetical protein